MDENTNVSTVNQTPAPAGFCAKCGAPLAAGQAFCDKCGQPAGAAAGPQPGFQAPPKSGGSKVPLIIAGVVVVFAVIAAAVFFLKPGGAEGGLGPAAAPVSDMTFSDLEPALQENLDEDMEIDEEETSDGGQLMRYTFPDSVVLENVTVEAVANADGYISQITFTNGSLDTDAFASQSDLWVLAQTDSGDWTLPELRSLYCVLEISGVYEAAGGDLDDISVSEVCGALTDEDPIEYEGWVFSGQVDEGAEQVVVSAIFQG